MNRAECDRKFPQSVSNGLRPESTEFHSGADAAIADHASI
jgi:hypothetical protein